MEDDGAGIPREILDRLFDPYVSSKALGRGLGLATVRTIVEAHSGGIDTVRLLGAFRIGAPDVPVIVSSGSAEEEMRELFRPHPYDAFLAKPYTMDELRQAIGDVASR